MAAHLDRAVVDTVGGTELLVEGLRDGVVCTGMQIMVAGTTYPCIGGLSGGNAAIRPTLGFALAFAPSLPAGTTSASLEVATSDGAVTGIDLTVAPPVYDAQAFALASLLNPAWDAGPRSIAEVRG